MKKNVKFITLLLGLSFTLFSINVNAREENGNNIFNNQAKATVTLTDNETGEIKEYTPEISKISSYTNNGTITEGFEVFVPVESPNGITPYNTDNTGKNEGGVNAVVYVNYDISANNEEVKVNEIWGSWTPNASFYYLTDQYVMVHSGVIYGKSLNRYPNSNSFDYYTGWGYNLRIWGDSSPRAITEATIHVAGMSDTHLIALNLTFS